MQEVLERYNNIAQKEQEDYLQKMSDYGIKVIRLTDEQLKPWVEHGRSVWPQMEEECGKEIIDVVRSKAK
jgi:TRAP-type C4-dicarboxylate transport system substrate-binding protein